MLLKTHVTITVFAILIFISAVEYKISFVCMALIATLIPDLDSSFSFLGKYSHPQNKLPHQNLILS